jgi:hypothetical protein
MKLPKISQTTISAIVGVIAGIVVALLPYLQNSPNPTVRMIAVVIMSLGFGNGIRAAPDSSETVKKPVLERLPAHEPITPAAIAEASASDPKL